MVPLSMRPALAVLARGKLSPVMAMDMAEALLLTLMVAPHTPTGLPRVWARGRLSPVMAMDMAVALLPTPMGVLLSPTGLPRVLARGRLSPAMAMVVLALPPTPM